jgi:hypothetical protein
MPESSDALLEHFREMRAELLASISGLTIEQMTERTIDGWSVKDNLAHLAFWDDLRADEVVRISAGYASALQMAPEQDELLNTLVHTLRRDLTLDQVMWELQHSRQRLEAAIIAAPPEALDPAQYGEAGLLSGHESEHARYIADWRQRLGY